MRARARGRGNQQASSPRLRAGASVAVQSGRDCGQVAAGRNSTHVGGVRRHAVKPLPLLPHWAVQPQPHQPLLPQHVVPKVPILPAVVRLVDGQQHDGRRVQLLQLPRSAAALGAALGLAGWRRGGAPAAAPSAPVVPLPEFVVRAVVAVGALLEAGLEAGPAVGGGKAIDGKA